MRLAKVLLLAVLLIPGPVRAELDIAAAEACFVSADQDGTNPALCIQAAQDPCMDNSDATPAVATLCFADARTAWSSAVSTAMATLDSRGDDRLAAFARIESRYDLLVNLLNCDRAEELAIALSDLEGAQVALQKARCQATATAITYMRLFLAARANL